MSINDVRGDSIVTASTNFGLFSSTDQGITWSDGSTRAQADNVTAMLRLPSGRLLVGGPRGIYFMDPGDTSWTKAYPSGVFRSNLILMGDGVGDVYTVDASFHGPNPGYGYPLKSTDGGITWSLDTAGITTLPVGGITTGIYYVDELGGQYASVWPGTSSWFLYSKGAGSSWRVDTAGMGISPSSGDGQLAVTGDGNGFVYCSNANTGMFRRPVSGGSWTHDTSGLGSALITRLCRGLNGEIYGSAYGGAYYRRSGGSWMKLNPPPAVSIGFTSTISVDGSGALLVAVRGGFPSIGHGVYMTRDNGQSWTKVGLDSASISSMVSFGDSTFVLTSGRGVYLINSPKITSVQVSNQVPSAYRLFQNYPNPFNPVTTIRFGLAMRMNVNLTIYDILGRRVAVLVNERREAGAYEVKFDGSKLASGMYLYRLQAGNFVQTRKLLLLK